METIVKAWSTPINGSTSYVWEQKLKASKTALKECLKKPSCSPTSLRKQATEKLLDLQMNMEQQDITSSEMQNEQAPNKALSTLSELRRRP